MKISFLIGLSILWLILMPYSCGIVWDSKSKLNWKEYYKTIDSAGNSQLKGVFEEEEMISFILKSDSIITKISCNSGFPTIYDTLIQLRENKFESKRFKTGYEISSEEVIATHYQKIIHPSSNWQGQTPWQEIHVARFPRIDK